MTNEPQIESLSHQSRKKFFWLLVVVFVVALPSLIFYTTGYRISFENEETAIVTTGGMYITTDNLEVYVYLDGDQVERPRLFRSAYYIQNIEIGLHRAVVQRDDLYTWVKVLPVDPYIVTETAAFNMPVVPHVRPITEYTTATGTPIYLGVSSSTELFSGVTTTVPFVTVPTRSTRLYLPNEEYVYVDSLFSTTSQARRSVFEALFKQVDNFRFATTTDPTATTTEPLIEKGGIRLVSREGEVYAIWVGPTNSIPYYYCINSSQFASTSLRYGEHVADEIERLSKSTTTPLIVEGNRICRPEIKLDRQRKDIYFYDFFPNTSDLVLLQLEDGLYATEIDDRSWQNAQMIYSGEDLEVLVENNTIYIKDQERYFELITEIESN